MYTGQLPQAMEEQLTSCSELQQTLPALYLVHCECMSKWRSCNIYTPGIYVQKQKEEEGEKYRTEP